MREVGVTVYRIIQRTERGKGKLSEEDIVRLEVETEEMGAG